MENKERIEQYTVSEKFLEETLKEWSNSLVGETMRRFEIFSAVKDIKSSVKELLHENCRHLKLLIKAFSSGVKFISRPREGK